MATNAQKTRQQLFGLLRAAPNDTPRQVAEFLNTMICTPAKNPLSAISDQTLTRHLEILTNGGTIGSAPGRLMLYGFGDTSHSGQWQRAVDALENLLEKVPVLEGETQRRMRLGEALCFLSERTLSSLPSNMEVCLLAGWLTGDPLTDEHVRLFRRRLIIDFCDLARDKTWLSEHSTADLQLHSNDCFAAAGCVENNQRLPKKIWLLKYVLLRCVFFAAGDKAKAVTLTNELFVQEPPV